MTAPERAGLERTLVDNPGTVTHLIEELTGEPLVADVIRQQVITAGAENRLGVPAGHALMHRIAVLKGRTTASPYVFAESMFVPQRIAEPVRSQLEQSSDPIGRVLVAYGMKLRKEDLPGTERELAHAPVPHSLIATDIVWSRAYRLLHEDEPVFEIREWFFRSVLEALDRPGREGR